MANEKTTVTVSKEVFKALNRVKRDMIKKTGEAVSWDEVMMYLVKLHRKEMRNARRKKKKEKTVIIGGAFDTGGGLQ